MIGEPTPRQLDALAAWWQCGGSNVAASRVMGVTPQVMRNTLMAFRREQRAPTNVALMQRYLAQVDGRTVLPATSHKASRSEPLFDSSTVQEPAGASRDSHSEPAAKVTEHLLGRRLTLPRRTVTLVPRTGVLVVDLQPQILRKQMIEPALRRGQPFHPSNTPPQLLERIPVVDLRQVQRPSIREVDPGPQWGILP